MWSSMLSAVFVFHLPSTELTTVSRSLPACARAPSNRPRAWVIPEPGSGELLAGEMQANLLFFFLLESEGRTGKRGW